MITYGQSGRFPRLPILQYWRVDAPWSMMTRKRLVSSFQCHWELGLNFVSFLSRSICCSKLHLMPSWFLRGHYHLRHHFRFSPCHSPPRQSSSARFKDIREWSSPMLFHLWRQLVVWGLAPFRTLSDLVPFSVCLIPMISPYLVA